MNSTSIHISSLRHKDVMNEFDNILKKGKYACFPAPDIKHIGKNLYLLGMPFNKKIHWFMAEETTNNGRNATLNIIDKHVIDGNSISKIITLPIMERGILDNTEYSLSNEVDRYNTDMKMIQAIRKNTMGDYDFYYSHENIFKITPRKSHANF
ncbi:hypothetical protein CJ195_11260 [Bacillus sp. UMB0899]|uniref:hypothetical protein n=1 Tax=Metabacillus schmidteae TaxID=2730405 RepID=UPI000C80A5B7|nr:hypothetical protein [Metabacillus schmidteae]PMC37334.1 hypothetical protein CJ195_11260 [Bacillus sp. UMB0899]